MTINQNDSLGDEGKEPIKEGDDSINANQNLDPQPTTETSDEIPDVKME